MNASTPGRWVTTSAEPILEAFYVTPPAPAPAERGTVLLLQEIFGVNAAMRGTAEALASLGFNVLAPDIFGHLERRVDLGYGPDDRKKGFELMQKLDMVRAVEDCAKAANWARAQTECNGKVAVVGFCIGGLLAVRFAAQFPCDAAVSFYGVRIHENIDALRKIGCPVQYHVGDQDTHIPASSVGIVAEAARSMLNASVHVYPGAGHGFFNMAREDVYHPESFELAGRRTSALLKEALS